MLCMYAILDALGLYTGTSQIRTMPNHANLIWVRTYQLLWRGTSFSADQPPSGGLGHEGQAIAWALPCLCSDLHMPESSPQQRLCASATTTRCDGVAEPLL